MARAASKAPMGLSSAKIVIYIAIIFVIILILTTPFGGGADSDGGLTHSDHNGNKGGGAGPLSEDAADEAEADYQEPTAESRRRRKKRKQSKTPEPAVSLKPEPSSTTNAEEPRQGIQKHRSSAFHAQSVETDAQQDSTKNQAKVGAHHSIHIDGQQQEETVTMDTPKQTDETSKDNFAPPLPGSGSNNNRLTVAVFIQIHAISTWPDLKQCVANVAATRKPPPNPADAPFATSPRSLDVYVAVADSPMLEKEEARSGPKWEARVVRQALVEEIGLEPNRVFVERVPNGGADVGLFLSSLVRAVEKEKQYDVVLKIHSKTDDVWRARMMESLCGTVSHVRSILWNFEQRSKLSLLATLGSAFSPVTPASDLYPHMVRRYGMVSGKAAFDPGTRVKMRWLDENISAIQDPPIKPQLRMKRLCIIAGTAFWVRYSDLRPTVMARAAASWLLTEMRRNTAYQVNHKIEHILERYFGSIIRSLGGQIAEIAPAVRPVPIVFPQFYATPENDEFWGPGYTEWSLLEKSKLADLQRPLPVSKGGLGYYNLTDIRTRERWTQLGKDAGVHGFMFYHYWFNGPKVPKNHMTLYRIQEMMAFEDGQPNMPFFFSWANEPWSRRWDGGDKSILLSQEYGDESDWTEHFIYLQKFFEHPRYQRIDGRPVFVIYRPGHLLERFFLMMIHFNKLARERMGVPGLHIMLTIGNFWKADAITEQLSKFPEVSSRFHFWPQLCGIPAFGDAHCRKDVTFNGKTEMVFEQPASELIHQQYFDDSKPTYWGASTGFDVRVRRPDEPKGPYLQISPQGWKTALTRSFASMNANRAWNISSTNLYFITAWNEWNEQAVMEPSDTHRDGYLRALSQALMTIPVKIVINGPKVNRGM